MSAISADKFFDAFIPAASEVIAVKFRPDCCIAATRITIEVLKHYEHEAVPLPVIPMLINRQAAELVHQHGRWPTTEETADWAAQGARQIVVGDPGEEHGANYWAGHLVAVADLDNVLWLVDLSIGQANRPDYGMEVGPLAVTLPTDFLDGGEMVVDLANGAVLTYKYAPRNLGFKSSNNWGKRMHRQSVATIIRQIEEARRGKIIQIEDRRSGKGPGVGTTGARR